MATSNENKWLLIWLATPLSPYISPSCTWIHPRYVILLPCIGFSLYLCVLLFLYVSDFFPTMWAFFCLYTGSLGSQTPSVGFKKKVARTCVGKNYQVWLKFSISNEKSWNCLGNFFFFFLNPSKWAWIQERSRISIMGRKPIQVGRELAHAGRKPTPYYSSKEAFSKLFWELGHQHYLFVIVPRSPILNHL